MSVHGWMCCTVTVLDEEYEEAVRNWAVAAYVSKGNAGRMTIDFEYEQAGYLETAFGYLRDDLASIPAPPEAWKATARYECLDYANEDGSMTEVDIEGGKAVRWRESRIMMVECEPCVDFETIGGTK